jgi:hypothetical protein
MNELSRRKFMMSAAGVTASVTLGQSSGAFAKSPKIEFGVQLYLSTLESTMT